GAHDAAAQGPAHALPRDRRPGMENGLARHARHDLDGGTHVDQDLVSGQDAIERDSIRGVDGVAPERGEIAVSPPRAPVDAAQGTVLCQELRAEEIGSGDHGPEWLAEKTQLR